ncbi:hypothetical protein GTP90_33640 [Rugamonas sp. FT81W]|uniref:GspL cytoplasmic actin-ATPase-like domain-containing protein n=1 Tax=Duganella vulcania TaxID=2692166 RepID=A0A845H098_9BURK|nr:hypothetical protein [Duganella vulcania]
MLHSHLLYLSSEFVWAYPWHQGVLGEPTRYPNERAGVDAFMDDLDARPYGPVYLMVDLIEEDFQRITLPHVTGRSGRRLLARRLLQQYRETPYRYVRVQGREPDGRQDDIALLSALTNPALVQPWVEALELLRAPLAGLYSTTLMTSSLVHKLGLADQRLLLVTQQSAGLRQSYFLDGQLKFSRLTLAVDRDGAPVDVARETAKTQQFLTSTRLIGRGEVLHTVILAPDETLDRLEPQCQDGPETAYHFESMETAADRTGLPATPELADTLLLTLLGRERPPSQYSLGEARRYFQLWRARLALFSASAVLAAGTLVWLGVDVWRYVEATSATDTMYAQARQYDERYRAALSTMTPAIDKTANMKAAVTVAQLLVRQGPQPLPLMTHLSAALDKVPQIRVLELDWKITPPATPAEPVATGFMASTSGTVVEPISSLMLGLPAKVPQALRLEAEIMVPPDNYREVVNTMNAFTQELARQPRMAVEIVQQPVDTRSNVKLSGKAGAGPAGGVETKARFILNLVWQP